MADSTQTRKSSAVKAIARRYEKVGLRTEPLDRLVDILSGLANPIGSQALEPLVGRLTWGDWDTRRRNRAIGFLPRDFLLDRSTLMPPLHYLPGTAANLLEKPWVDAAKTPKIVFRYRDVPMAALAAKNELPVGSLIGLVPRLKTTPTEDLVVVLNSRLFHFYWRHYFPRQSGEQSVPPIERLAGFQVPMLTKKVGGPFRKARDGILKRARANAGRLAAMDRVQEIAEEAGVTLIPMGETEGIIREINVPRPLTDVSDVKRRGPVVIFRRGSTIVTTTEEAATYLELWLQQRFDQLLGMTREDLEATIRMPVSTAHVVVVLQHRARIEAEINEVEREIAELQREAEDHLYDIYELDEGEREALRSSYA